MSLGKRRRRKCWACHEWFRPERENQVVCSPGCAYDKVVAEAPKRKRKQLREAKAKAKTRGQWLKEAQAAFNSFIRARDNSLPCISCGRDHKGQWHASHYRSVGACSGLRFSELNVHKACSACNTHLSGNIVEYRLRLVEKIGEAAVEWLEGPHKPQRLEVDEIKAIRKKYKLKAQELNERIEMQG